MGWSTGPEFIGVQAVTLKHFIEAGSLEAREASGFGDITAGQFQQVGEVLLFKLADDHPTSFMIRQEGLLVGLRRNRPDDVFRKVEGND